MLPPPGLRGQALNGPCSSLLAALRGRTGRLDGEDQPPPQSGPRLPITSPQIHPGEALSAAQLKPAGGARSPPFLHPVFPGSPETPSFCGATYLFRVGAPSQRPCPQGGKRQVAPGWAQNGVVGNSWRELCPPQATHLLRTARARAVWRDSWCPSSRLRRSASVLHSRRASESSRCNPRSPSTDLSGGEEGELVLRVVTQVFQTS